MLDERYIKELQVCYLIYKYNVRNKAKVVLNPKDRLLQGL